MSDEGSLDELIDLKDFLLRRTEIVQEDYFLRNKNVQERIKQEMNLSEENATELEEMCNPRHLRADSELTNITVESLDSEYLSVLDYVKTTYGSNTNRVQSIEMKFKKELARLNELEPEEGDLVETPDLILTLQISQPLNPKLRKLAWSEDFLVLGQMYLHELKEKIACFRNEIRIGEFSEDPDSVKDAPVMRDCIKSGFFFIEDTFYNDLRGDNEDCSIQLIKWASEQNIANFKSAQMETTKFIDLKVRIGYPYLFTHLGDCEHLIVFTSIKLLNPATDCYCRSKYPIVKDKSRGRFAFCWCCNKLYAKWIVCNSEYAVDDPTFLCERCLRNTHYEWIDESADETPGAEENREDQATTSKDTTTKPNRRLRKLFNFKAYHFSQM